jgi:hypothetical protein
MRKQRYIYEQRKEQPYNDIMGFDACQYHFYDIFCARFGTDG